MKIISNIILLAIFPINTAISQISDTLEYKTAKKLINVSDKKNVSLFFPKPIRQGIAGRENFQFTYNTEEEQYFGIIKGTKGGESNLLVITNDGQVYSFIIAYQSDVSKLNYFFTEDDSIGNENPNREEEENEEIQKLREKRYALTGEYETIHYKREARDTSFLRYNKDRITYMRKFCSNLTTIDQEIRGGKKTKDNDITLALKNIVFNYNEMYFVMEITNDSGVDYDINFLDISIANNKKRKTKSAQTIIKKPILTYQLLNRIPRGTTKEIVYVLPKFSINEEKKVILELNELNGERNLQLDIPITYINNPN